MDRSTATGLLGDHFPSFTDIAIRAHRDFTECVLADHRATLNATVRAGYVQQRMMYHLLTAFGESGPVRLVAEDSLRYLLIEGEPESAGLRWKKVDRYTLLSSNHQSGRQDDLRRNQAFLFGQVAHLIFGYTENDDDPLNPTIERIVLTCEHSTGIDWMHPVWTADAAPESVRIETGFEQGIIPPLFTIKPKKKADDNQGDQREKKAE